MIGTGSSGGAEPPTRKQRASSCHLLLADHHLITREQLLVNKGGKADHRLIFREQMRQGVNEAWVSRRET